MSIKSNISINFHHILSFSFNLAKNMKFLGLLSKQIIRDLKKMKKKIIPKINSLNIRLM